MTTFFLGCVIVAGVFGAFTVSYRIFLVQSLPAVIAVILHEYAWKDADNWNSKNPVFVFLWLLLGIVVGGVILGVYVGNREAEAKKAQGAPAAGAGADDDKARSLIQH